VVGDVFPVLRVHDGCPDFHVADEHLVEVATLTMRLGPTRYRRLEVVLRQSLTHRHYVIVEITAHDDWCVGVLFDDILYDVQDSLGSVSQVLLFSRVEIAVENLDIRVSQLQLGPTEICPERLHQLVSGVRSSRIPATPVALEHRLVGPKASQEHWALQLRFAEADHLRSVATHEFVDHLLLRLGVDTSDIKGKEFELLPVRSHFRETAIDVVSPVVRGRIRQVLSVLGLHPS
jgi:hypothetical protein